MYRVVEKIDNTIDLYKGNTLVRSFFSTIDLDLSIALLKEFNNTVDSNGNKLFSKWKYKEYYLYPAVQEWLYWDFFVGIVACQDVRKEISNNEYIVSNPNYYVTGRMKRINRILYEGHPYILKIIYNLLAGFFRIRFLQKECIFLNDDGFDSIRYRSFKNVLNSKTLFHRVERISLGALKRFFGDRSTFVLGKFSLFNFRKKINHEEYKISKFLNNYMSKSEFIALINSVDKRCNDMIVEAKSYEKALNFKAIKSYISYDQVETSLPLLLVLKSNNIETYGYQHGPLTRFHSGWIGYGIPSKYCNAVPDYLIVWGEYWKDLIVMYSNKYTYENIIVGAHLNKVIDYKFPDWDFELLDLTGKKNSKLNILVPYEFLANNIEISKYLELFIDFGWKVTIKFRPIEIGNANVDVLSYSDRVQRNAIFVYDIDDKDLGVFDVVVCTQSVFAVEMMRFNTSIWYLETSVHFLDCLVKDDIAHCLSISTAIEIYTNPIILSEFLKPKYTLKDYTNVFSNKTIECQIDELIGIRSDM